MGIPQIQLRSYYGLGVAGSVALLIYIDFLGTTGEINRLMRRIGAMLYFTLIPLAQSVMLYQHYKLLRNKPESFYNTEGAPVPAHYYGADVNYWRY
jgi:hypothetical protein